MFSDGRRILIALALLLVTAAAVPAQENRQSPQRDDDFFVTQKMFQNRVFDVKNRDPLALARVLSPLTSGFKGATVSPNQEFRTITVRDFPENIAVIEEAIRRLDTPEAPRPSVEFKVHILVASNDASVANRYPAELSEVVGQLQSSLGYKNFGLLGSQVVRSKEGRDTSNRGVADQKAAGDSPAIRHSTTFTYTIHGVTLDNVAGRARVQLEEFSMEMVVPVPRGSEYIPTNVGFRNPVTLREGEKVVAGTLSIADKSVVVVISAGTTK
ncbi:MAG TPA: secretin N-terminal domain-containing protein [Pyrinomonadaceae bacterium]|jgi:type II secretory pathway component GspD/PulD (secretin)|nr:secretin N-terminal domain-containing protein [Pyrinomonadaceae bacterium]